MRFTPVESIMQPLNLIPRHRLLERQCAVHRARWTTACATYGALIVLACVVSLAGRHATQARELRTRIETVKSEIHEANDTLTELRQHVATAQRTLRAATAVGPQPDWSIFLTALASQTGDQIVLRSCELLPVVPEESGEEQPRDPQIVDAFLLNLAGYGKTQREVSEFVLRLEETSLLDAVALMSSRREPFLTDHAIAFEVRCSVGKAGRSE